jgi:hypothetical protein
LANANNPTNQLYAANSAVLQRHATRSLIIVGIVHINLYRPILIRIGLLIMLRFTVHTVTVSL